jgi:hypothetical protein
VIAGSTRAVGARVASVRTRLQSHSATAGHAARHGVRWPRPVLAPLLAAVALASALTTVPTLVRQTFSPPAQAEDAWDHPELYPGHLGIPAIVVERSQRLIPEDAPYAIVIGDQIPVVAEGIGIVQGLHYFLVPRPWTEDLSGAEWVIAWGHSSETLGVPVSRAIGLAPGVNLVEVAR